MPDLASLLDSMTPEQRKGALIALDAVSRPLKGYEIEAELRAWGIHRNAAHRLGNLIKHLDIIAVTGPPDCSETQREVNRHLKSFSPPSG
jgi:hypothetical protein